MVHRRLLSLKGARPPPATPCAAQVPFRLCFCKVPGPRRSADADLMGSLAPAAARGAGTGSQRSPDVDLVRLRLAREKPRFSKILNICGLRFYLRVNAPK